MIQNQYSSLFLDQSKDLIWATDHHFCLVYANKAYLNLMKEVTGREKKLNEPVLIEGFGDGYIEKWKAYYERGLNGEYFEIEEHFYNPNTNKAEYSLITFNPIADENDVIVNVACQSRDITSFKKSNTEAEKLLDSSLDVICQMDEHGIFTNVNAACNVLWGYEKHELIGKPYIDFVIEEDVEKTNEVAAEILLGKTVTTFENRYKRKDGGIAFNLWSVRYDQNTKNLFCVARNAREKIKKEELLIESEHRFKALVQEGSDLIAILDEAGIYIYVSPTSKGILGMAPEEFIGKSALDYIHPKDAERTLNSLGKITSESRVELEPFRFKNKNGEWRWIETVLTNMLDNPSVEGIVANSRDITESKNIFNTIAANDQFNKTVIESSPDCLKILDNEGRLMYMNFNGLCQMEIDDFTEIKNKQWGLLWGPENEALVRESVDKALTGETVQFTAFCPTVKGKPKWWDVKVSPVIRAGEPIEKIISVSRDITAKKEEEQRLKLLESVITNTNDIVLITEAEPFDKPGPRILYVNEAFTRLTGYTAEEVIGKTPRILQGPNSNKAELARLGRALRNWEPCEITTINYKKNGEEFWINFSISPVADETGWYTHWIAIERDVTEQKNKELENQLIAQISANFDLENDFEKATKELCKAVALYGKVDWVELWTSNLENTQMQHTSYYLSNPEDEVIYSSESHVKSFNRDEGLIGKVWVTGKQTLWEDLSQSKDFERKNVSKKIGLKSVLGIPLIFDDKVLGVISVGVKHSSGYLKNYLNIFQRLEKFIGSELQRKTLEIELRNLFDTISDIISVGDFQGKFLRINKSGCELLGYNEKEILQKGFEEFIHPEDLNICYQELQQLHNGKDTFDFEARFITKSGEILWLSWNCKAKIKEGLIYCTAKNITEEKKFKKLNKQTNKLGKIGTWEYDLIENKLFWSNEVYLLHDLEPDTFVPNVETAIDFYKEEHKSYVADKITKSLTLGVYLDYEAVIITKSKKEKWVRVIGNPEFIEGKCVKFIGSFQDTTDRREAEMRLQSLSDNLPGVVYQYIIHPDGTDSMQFISGMVEKMWGYTTNEVMQNIDLLWGQIKQGGDIEEVKSSIAKSIETKSKWTCRFKIINRTGEIKTHFGSGTPIFLADGTIVFHVMVLDITQEAKNEELLEEVTNIARIGSWEVDLMNNSMFWSDITHEIHETSEDFKPQLSEAIDFYREDFRELATESVNTCIETGTPFDFEAILITHKNNEVWVRAMGRAEMVDGKCVRIFGSFQDINERKITENQKNSLLTTLEKSLNEIYVFDAETLKFSYVNQGALINLGYSEQEVKELTPLDIKPDYSATTFNQLVHPLVTKEKEKVIFFTNHKRKNGSLYPVEVHLQFVAEGNNKRFLAVILDITDLKETERLLDSASKLARVGSWELILKDNEEHKMFWSSMTKNIVEIDESFEPTLADGINLHKEPSRTLIAAAVKEAIEKGEAFDLELELVTGKENDIWVRCIGDTQIENGKVTRIFGSYQDINTLKVNEIALQESLKTLEDYKFSLDQSAIVAYTDSKGVISFVNDNFCKISQYSKEELIGKTHQIINSKHHPREFFADLWKTISSGKVWRGEIKNAAKDGSYYWVDTTIVPFLDEKDKPVQYLAIRFDVTDRKIAEDSVLKTLEEKNNILESIGDAFFAVNKEWTITYWNRSAESVLGKMKEDVVGENLWNEFADAIDSDFYTNYHYAMETMETQSFEAFYETTNQWIEVTAYPSEDGLSVYFKDITQRKIENVEIAKSEEKRRLIMNGAMDAIISIDTKETITFWNAQAEVIFGWKEEEVMGKPLSEMIIPEAFRKYHVEGIKNYLKTGEGKALNVLLELSAIRRNGEEFPIELTVIPIKQGDEEFFCAFIRDITQRKKAEREIKQANERFEKATEATNDVIWDWDIESGNLFRSNAIDNFFGVGTSKVLKKKNFWTDNFHKDDTLKIKNSIQKALEDPNCNRWEEDYRILINNNEIIFVIDRGLILRNKNGKAIRMVGAMTNITEQKKQEEKLTELNQSLIEQAVELKRSNEDLEQFAFITSHDLQEPLRMISSFMDQLKRKYADRLDEKGLQYIHFATDGAKRMKQIILDLLLYSRANKPTDQNELINLNEIVSEYTQMRRKVIAEKRATITVQELPSIQTYRAPITQIFHCLLDNALKYVDENKPPNIKIGAVEKENVWQFYIKDNGIGIDQKFFNKIFIIFQRLQNRKENDGNGIGLSVAKRSIEFLGGEIWVESEIGKGSTFFFTIFKIKQLV